MDGLSYALFRRRFSFGQRHPALKNATNCRKRWHLCCSYMLLRFLCSAAGFSIHSNVYRNPFRTRSPLGLVVLCGASILNAFLRGKPSQIPVTSAEAVEVLKEASLACRRCLDQLESKASLDTAHTTGTATGTQTGTEVCRPLQSRFVAGLFVKERHALCRAFISNAVQGSL